MIGKEIFERRKRIGLTQRELARLINVKPNTMSQYENGMRKIPIDVLANVAKALRCKVEELAYEEMGVSRNSKQDGETSDVVISMSACDARIFTDPLDNEIIALLKDLDRIAKEKVIAYMRDQKVITLYYRAVKERES
ncbi:MAG: helix-turn-helix transcriptional regulator [Synergistaceae bacterium]|nr:helix-turn-helix transcriptional regulator [Synergistaceae bacterium]